MTLSLQMNKIPNITAFIEHENKLTKIVFRKKFLAAAPDYTEILSSKYLLDENLATLHFSLLLLRSHPLNQIFLRKIDQLLSSGLIQKLEEQTRPSTKPEDNEAQTLKMDHLDICFNVIMICLGLSCVVFLIECLVKSFGIGQP
jgi:hypothetical protein